METLLNSAWGQFHLKRFPSRKNQLLRAWDAADEYLLNYLHAQLPFRNPRIAILNDGFGALAISLNQYRPVSISDSYLSQLATRSNMQLNGIATENVSLYDTLNPPDTELDFLLIKVPKTLALLEDQLLRLRPKLRSDSLIIAAGMVKNLPVTVWKLLETLIGPTNTSLAEKKARLIFTKLDSNLRLPESRYPVYYRLENAEFMLCNHANVFSRESLDIGARFMLQHLPENPAYRDIIDLGCGNGVLGLCLAERFPDANLTFVDESYMAIASARENFRNAFQGKRQAEFLISDGLSGISSESVDCIVCNPPFHQQHAIGDDTALRMFRQAHQVLRQGGEFRVIGNRHLNYHLSLKKYFGNVQQIAANPKFVILKSEKQ
jgi:23S rRNA (guanine1835-N2)-methyltransferase